MHNSIFLFSVLQDPCNDQAGWMDFLQILVHQHAKTIVTLQVCIIYLIIIL